MSRNYELLRRAGKEEVLFGRPDSDSRPSDNGHRRVDLGRPRPSDSPSHSVPRRLDLGTHGQEEVVKLVQRVFVAANSHAPRAVVFASVQGNGSSEICSRAGQVLAAQGSGSVCLVDGNLRAPSLHQLLGVGMFPGLADATFKSGPIRDFAQRIAGGNLWLIPPGWPAGEVPQLFASDRLRSRMRELRGEFDYVLIDAPPISSCADAVLLGHLADGAILVLEANSTRRETARMAKETFEAANVNLLGAILNNRTFPIPEALYRKL
jgi:Mrp family chromosome partitioning ATPase